MNADTMLDILTLQEAVKVLKRGNVPVFYDYEPQFPLGADYHKNKSPRAEEEDDQERRPGVAEEDVEDVGLHRRVRSGFEVG